MHIPLSPPDTTAILASLAPDQMVRLLGDGLHTAECFGHLTQGNQKFALITILKNAV